VATPDGRRTVERRPEAAIDAVRPWMVGSSARDQRAPLPWYPSKMVRGSVASIRPSWVLASLGLDGPDLEGTRRNQGDHDAQDLSSDRDDPM